MAFGGTKEEIIALTLTFEGGYGVDNNGSQVYCGINEAANPSWEGWVIVGKWVASLGGKKAARGQVSPDPALHRSMITLIDGKYWNGHNFDSYNDKRVVAQLFDHIYNAGPEGLNSVLKNAFRGTTQATSPTVANSDMQAVSKVIQARKAYYARCTWYTSDAGKRNFYTKAADKRVSDIAAMTGAFQYADLTVN
jgi:hypothetical protein